MTISFGAKLKIDENYGKNLPSYINGRELETLATEYKKLIEENEVFSTLMPEDTIVLSSKRHPQSFSVDLNIYDKNSTRPYQTTINVSRGCKPIFRVRDLSLLTCQYIAYKFNVTKDRGKPLYIYVRNAITDLMNEHLGNKED